MSIVLNPVPPPKATLQTVCDNQGVAAFNYNQNINGSLVVGTSWIMKDSSAADVFRVDADTTADPTFGSGVLVGGNTFRSGAGVNLFSDGLTIGNTFIAGTERLDVFGGNIRTDSGLISTAASGIGLQIGSPALLTVDIASQLVTIAGATVDANTSVITCNGAVFQSPNVYSGELGIVSGAAYPLTKEVSFVQTAGSDVMLPPAVLGAHFVVLNEDGVNALDVLPSTGQEIDGLGINTPYSIPAGGSREFWGRDASSWRSR